jgi:hypothetical protein
MEEKYLMVNSYLGHSGKMIAHSKSGYMRNKPENLVVFNSNVCVKSGKIWYGDLDITESYHQLKDLTDFLGEEIFVLRESDGRFENEDSPRLDQFVIKFSPNSDPELNEMYIRYKF